MWNIKKKKVGKIDPYYLKEGKVASLISAKLISEQKIL
jgi:hypothetical protein